MARYIALCREEPIDPQTEEALVASKMDHLAEEYSQLLVGQLDQQRAFYEQRLQHQSEEIEEVKRQAHEMCRSCESARTKACEDAKTSDRLRRAAEQKVVRGVCVCIFN